MFKNFRDKIALSGITVLGIGVALLIFTFFSAYGFLVAGLSPISTQDLVQTFGEALGPLIAAAIHLMYLGVMGWVSSLITIRGVTIVTQLHKGEAELTKPPQTAQQKLEAQKAKAKPEKGKPEAMPADPEMVVIPLEEMEAPPQTRQERKLSS